MTEQAAGKEGAAPAEMKQEEVRPRDPAEAAFAEQAIFGYAHACLDRFRDRVQTALDGFLAWVGSHHDAQAFDNHGFSAQMGEVFLQHLLSATGGRATPIGATLFAQLDSFIDQQARAEHEPTFFIPELAAGARDFTWYLRDNLAAVLGNHWTQLCDLAYAGSTDFVAALHALGMPSLDWPAHRLQGTMVAVAERVRANQPKSAQEALRRDPQKEAEERQRLIADETLKPITA